MLLHFFLRQHLEISFAHLESSWITKLTPAHGWHHHYERLTFRVEIYAQGEILGQSMLVGPGKKGQNA